MNQRSPAQTGLGWLAALVVVGLAIMALRPGRTVIEYDNSPATTIPESGAMVVGALRESGGLSVFGLGITDPTYLVEIRFTTAAGCVDTLDSGDSWPAADPRCATSAEIAGTVAAVGIAPSGQSLIGVEFEVSRTCFESLSLGQAWPSDGDCAR